MVAYTEIRDFLRTGDIVLYSGRQVISSIIKGITRSHWSHVGMVVRLPSIQYVTVWESTRKGTGLRDVNDGEFKRGVQLVPLSDRVDRYDGEVAIRRLTGAGLDEGDFRRLWERRRDLSNRPYETDLLEMIKAAWDGPFGMNEEDLASIFCSELVAEAYQTLGLLREDVPSNEYVPSDFSSERSLRLLRGKLGDEVFLTPG